MIGSGNVATALGMALLDAGITITEVFSLNINNSKTLAEKANSSCIDNLEDMNTTSDLYIIAIPDKEIGKIFKKLKNTGGIVVHTSGSQPVNNFENKNLNYGIFYPLQTFTVDKKINFSDVPICIEGSNKATSESLIQLANKISNKVVHLDYNQRQYLHLAAVTVNNFTNLLYSISKELLDEKGIDFSLLHSLIGETANKINKVKPEDAQTGPARRNDIQTINMHLELLDKYPEFKEIYELLSDQITKKYHDKL